MSQSTPSGGSGVLSHAESSARHPSEALDELPVSRRMRISRNSRRAVGRSRRTARTTPRTTPTATVWCSSGASPTMSWRLSSPRRSSRGDVRRVRLVRHHKAKPTGEHKGYGFITRHRGAGVGAPRDGNDHPRRALHSRLQGCVRGCEDPDFRDEREQSRRRARPNNRLGRPRRRRDPPPLRARPSTRLSPRIRHLEGRSRRGPREAHLPPRLLRASLRLSPPPRLPPRPRTNTGRIDDSWSTTRRSTRRWPSITTRGTSCLCLSCRGPRTRRCFRRTCAAGGRRECASVSVPRDGRRRADAAAFAPGRYSERRVFVGGLPRSVTDDTLGWFFSRWGAVEEANVVRDPLTGASRRFGFVAFARRVRGDGQIARHRRLLGYRGVQRRRRSPPRTRDAFVYVGDDARRPRQPCGAVDPGSRSSRRRRGCRPPAQAPRPGRDGDGDANANDAPEDVRADRSAAGERSRAKIRRWCRRRQPPCFTRARARTRRRRTRVRRRPARASRGAGAARLATRTREMSLAHLAPLVADGGEGLDASWTRRERASVDSPTGYIAANARGGSRRSRRRGRGWEIRVACRPASPRSCGAGVVHADAVEGEGDVAAELAELEEGSILYRTSSRTSSTELDDDGPASRSPRSEGSACDRRPERSAVSVRRRSTRPRRSPPSRRVDARGPTRAWSPCTDSPPTRRGRSARFLLRFRTVLNVEASMGIPGVSSSLALVELPTIARSSERAARVFLRRENNRVGRGGGEATADARDGVVRTTRGRGRRRRRRTRTNVYHLTSVYHFASSVASRAREQPI